MLDLVYVRNYKKIFCKCMISVKNIVETFLGVSFHDRIVVLIKYICTNQIYELLINYNFTKQAKIVILMSYHF